MPVYRITKNNRRRNFLGRLSMNSTLILINVVFFILVSILLSFNIIGVEFIAIQPANILQGNYLWTFITSMFMHGNFFHIFANMLSLFFVGSLVEKILGPKRYFWFYIAAGIFAGLFFVLASATFFPADLQASAVGASGALFGIVGLLVLMTPNLPVYVFFIPIPIKMKYAGPGLLFLIWLISLGVDGFNVGNTAHLGGLVIGLVYGFYLRKKYPRKTNYISRYFS